MNLNPFNFYKYKKAVQEALDKQAFDERIREVEKQYEEKLASTIANLNVVDLVRTKLKGFDPSRIWGIKGSDSMDVLEYWRSLGRNDMEFLNAILNVSKTPELEFLFDFIVATQVLYSAKEGLSLDEINFGRASINGVELVREEIGRLVGIHTERTKQPESFDKHEAL